MTDWGISVEAVRRKVTQLGSRVSKGSPFGATNSTPVLWVYNLASS